MQIEQAETTYKLFKTSSLAPKYPKREGRGDSSLYNHQEHYQEKK
jgi:hypothetical protein